MLTLQKPLHSDIPVKPTELKGTFHVPAMVFEGDLPAPIFHLQLITRGLAGWKAEGEIIAVFSANAGHVTLLDNAFNAERMAVTGNPYKELLSGLMKRGVQIQLCGATAAVHEWGNADLLPGVKVNTGAMARMSQLAREGFVGITEWD
jgi:intracellular sulfur oxidation DsrE/DsrF family protein